MTSRELILQRAREYAAQVLNGPARSGLLMLGGSGAWEQRNPQRKPLSRLKRQAIAEGSKRFYARWPTLADYLRELQQREGG